MNDHRGRIIWFTGLPGTGKYALAGAADSALRGLGYRTYLLDGDNVRQGLNRDCRRPGGEIAGPQQAGRTTPAAATANIAAIRQQKTDFKSFFLPN